MEAVSYSEARKNLKKYFDHAYQNHDPVIITRKNNENIIIMSLDDYNSITETHYLLSSENNTKRLLTSLQQLRDNQGIERDIIE